MAELNTMNSHELTSALKSIEIETVNQVELHYLREENERLRNDLFERHNVRLREIEETELKHHQIWSKLHQLERDHWEILRLREVTIKASRQIDEAMEIMFRLGCNFFSVEKANIAQEDLKKLHVVLHKTGKELNNNAIITTQPTPAFTPTCFEQSSNYPSSSFSLPFTQTSSLSSLSSLSVPPSQQSEIDIGVPETTVQNTEVVEKDIRTILNEIRQFDFESFNVTEL